jgi:threonine/homoserine/homoserine lactone efflux protein
MTAETIFLKAMAAAILVSAPPGPASALCATRTLRFGLRAGLISALGVASADIAYGMVASFGVSLLHLPPGLRPLLALAAATLLTVIGIATLRRALRRRRTAPSAAATAERPPPWLLGLSTFGIGLSTIGTIPGFLALYAALDVRPEQGTWMPLIAGLVVGSLLWWILLCTGIDRLRARSARFEQLFEVAAGCLILLGAVAAAGSTVG